MLLPTFLDEDMTRWALMPPLYGPVTPFRLRVGRGEENIDGEADVCDAIAKLLVSEAEEEPEVRLALSSPPVAVSAKVVLNTIG